MPQASPMMWLLLFTTFIFMIMIMWTIMFFQWKQQPKGNQNIPKMNNKKMNWQW